MRAIYHRDIRACGCGCNRSVVRRGGATVLAQWRPSHNTINIKAAVALGV
jgi:hypothetical protein